MIPSIHKLVSRIAIMIILILPGSLLVGMSNSAYAQGGTRTFPETGKTVSGRFLEYWDEHGGLAQQGYPISEEMQERSDTDGNTYTVQYFERAVFEKHPEYQRPYDVLLSLLGTFEYQGRYPDGAPNQQANTDNTRTFPETGKTIGGRFRQYWEEHGGLAQQGYPLTNEFEEVSSLNGQKYKVQYFERAVFEYHPENQQPYDVLLSQLGTFRYQAKYATVDWTPKKMWGSGAGTWSWDSTKPVAGDFNGDGRDDIAVLYKYPGNDTALFTFDFSKGDPSPVQVWRSGAGNWNWDSSKPVAGDLNGDGKDDIAIFYDYGNNDTALFAFDFNGIAVAPAQVWRSGAGNWGWDRTTPVAGDFNGDGKAEVGAFYNYLNNTTGLFTFDFSSGSPVLKKVWDSGAGTWSWDSTKPVAGDFNGDGKDDIAVLYKYPSNDTALFTFDFSKGDPSPVQVWRSGVNNWSGDNSTPVAGDFNGDRKDDVGVLYRYPSNDTALFTFDFSKGDPSPVRVWRSGVNNWSGDNSKPVAGNFHGDGKASVGVFYNYGNNNTALFVFK